MCCNIICRQMGSIFMCKSYLQFDTFIFQVKYFYYGWLLSTEIGTYATETPEYKNLAQATILAV